MNNQKNRILLFIMTLVVSSMMLTSCVQSPQETNTIEVADLVGGLEEREEVRVQAVKDAKKDIFDRYYRAPYYFDDFAETEKKLTKDLEDVLEKNQKNSMICQ